MNVEKIVVINTMRDTGMIPCSIILMQLLTILVLMIHMINILLTIICHTNIITIRYILIRMAKMFHGKKKVLKDQRRRIFKKIHLWKDHLLRIRIHNPTMQIAWEDLVIRTRMKLRLTKNQMRANDTEKKPIQEDNRFAKGGNFHSNPYPAQSISNEHNVYIV